ASRWRSSASGVGPVLLDTVSNVGAATPADKTCSRPVFKGRRGRSGHSREGDGNRRRVSPIRSPPWTWQHCDVQSESRSSQPVRSPSRPAPRRRLSVDRRRDELIEAALDLLSQRGPEEVSVDDVAQAAGASRALVYHYFGTKQELYAAALSKAAAELTRRL